MREINFRGMTTSGEWVYGFVRQNCNPNAKYVGWFIADGMHSPLAYEVRPETVGQFTGRNDKNGVGIFDGDLIEVTHNVSKYKHIEEVEWDELFTGYGDWTDFNSKYIEIVGNKYEKK